MVQLTRPHELQERVVYTRAVRQEEATSRTEIVEEEKLLLFSNLPMIPTGCFGEELLILNHLLLVRERDSVDTLQRVIVGIAEEVGRRILRRGSSGEKLTHMRRADLRHHERLDFTRVRNMWADTEVNHRSTAVYRRRATIRDLRLDEVLLVLVVLDPCVSARGDSSICRSKRTPNISSSFSFETKMRSNFCFSLIAKSDSFSSAG